MRDWRSNGPGFGYGRCVGAVAISFALFAIPSSGTGYAADAASPPPLAWNDVPLEPGTYRQHPTEYSTDTVDIPVRPNGGEIEYMLNMKRGDSIVYTWRAAEIEDPELLTSEFHGHTERVGSAPGDLIFYRQATGASENGALLAPFDGIHGWYLRNDTDAPVVVTLTVSGFYELIPGQVP